MVQGYVVPVADNKIPDLTLPTTIRGIKDTNGKLAIKSTVIANTLNNYFVDVAENISRNIPRTPKSPIEYLNCRCCTYYMTPILI